MGRKNWIFRNLEKSLRGDAPIALFFGLAISLMSAGSFASEYYVQFRSIRQNGMGGAAIAVVDDETSLLTNPAGLGKLRGEILTLIDPDLEINSADYSIAAGQNLLTQTSLQDVENMMSQTGAGGQHFHLNAQAMPSFVVPNFGIGFFGKYTVNSDSTVTNVHIDFANDYSFVLGYCLRFLDGRLKLGFNIKATDRSVATLDTAPNTSLNMSQSVQEGIGVGSDVGLLITLPWDYLPTLGVVLRDAGNTSYNLNQGYLYNTTARPPDQIQDVDLGLSISPILGKSTRMQVAIDYLGEISAAKELDSMKRVHAGMEFNFGDLLFLRAGMNQRYWTAGVEIALQNIQIQVASYGEEIGTSTSYLEDRRFEGKIAFRF